MLYILLYCAAAIGTFLLLWHLLQKTNTYRKAESDFIAAHQEYDEAKKLVNQRAAELKKQEEERKKQEEERRKQEAAQKRQEEERRKREKQQELERKKEEAIAHCKEFGHDGLPLGGDQFGFKKGLFIQIDRNGYQKEVCKCCGKVYSSKKRLVEIDAPEFQDKYIGNIDWRVETETNTVGKVTFDIDTKSSAYLYAASSKDTEIAEGDIFAYLRIKDRQISQNNEFPADADLQYSFCTLDANGHPIDMAMVIHEGHNNILRNLQGYNLLRISKDCCGIEAYGIGVE